MKQSENKTKKLTFPKELFIFVTQKDRFTTVHLLLAIIISIFLVESFIMGILLLLPPLSSVMYVFIDSILLVTFLFPVFYFILFRPMQLLLQKYADNKEARKESMEQSRTLMETAGDAIICLQEGDIIYEWNKKAEQLFGYTMKEAIGKQLHPLIVPERYREKAAKGMEQFFRTGKGHLLGKVVEIKALRRNGTEFDAEISISAMRVNGIWKAAGIIRDITERKQMESNIRNSLEEKELLLKEIHHRVKNNLQVISSLISLQSSQIENKSPAEVLDESQNRIRAMAFIHEKLYKSSDLAKINFGDYVRSLTEYLMSAYQISTEKITVKIDIADVALDIAFAIPCGLILNELISNAFKHAFPGDRNGEITIMLVRQEHGLHLLTFKDNGIGLPSKVKLDKSDSLGLQIIDSLVKQIGGTIQVKKEKGSSFEIKFKKEENKDG
ncbi:MAG: histidine kinase dimerization/phosphoacceptor domain -containing protein [Leptospirales bacterium]